MLIKSNVTTFLIGKLSSCSCIVPILYSRMNIEYGVDMSDRRLKEDRARARLASQAVAYGLGVSPDEINAPTRGTSRAAFARQMAIYLTHVVFELSLARTAQAFGRDRSTAAYACHRVEDRRDDPDFDAFLDALESCLSSAPKPLCHDLSAVA